MTPDPEGPVPDDTPAPPAFTRWTEGEPGEESELMPPYIPGRKLTPEEPLAEVGGGGTEPPWSEIPTRGEVSGPELEPEPLSSWDTGDIESTTEPEPADSVGSSFPFDMPMSETAEPGTGAGRDEADSRSDQEMDWGIGDTAETAASAFPELDIEPEPEGGWPPDSYFRPDESDPSLSGAEDEFEVPGFGGVGSAGAAPLGMEDTPSPSGGQRAGSAAEELAGRLEELAARLRAEGREAVERELASDDRLASLLAGILSGYLAARGD